MANILHLYFAYLKFLINISFKLYHTLVNFKNYLK